MNELSKINNVKLVLLGDKKYIQGKYPNTIDLQCKTTIRDAINVVKDLDYMIAVDSGLMHVALTLHVPTVCIFSA